MLVLVSYDVSTVTPAGRNRLRRIATICADFGQRVQYSVFECRVTKTQWTMLRGRLLAAFDEGEDSLRFYFLGEEEAASRVEHHGTKPSIDFGGPLVL
jgi:CRISPR-associated protein Cas2